MIDCCQNEISLQSTDFTLFVENRYRNTNIIQSAKVLKLLSGTGLDTYEMNAVIATLNFILHNSVMFQIS